MSFIRKKKTASGRFYAYEVTSTWDAQKKQSRCVSKYLGVVDEKGGVIPKGALVERSKKQRLGLLSSSTGVQYLLDFGDSFLVSESIKKSAIYPPLEEFFQKHEAFLPLMTYRLCHSGPMYNAHHWLQGSVLRMSTPEGALHSQAISRLLVSLGSEKVQRDFFETYLKCEDSKGERNIIIDATSLPNHIESDFNAWGYSEGQIEKQFRFHCVVDQETKQPLFYRHVPGNIPDVVSLQNTLQELNALGLRHTFVLLDAGYCSEENIERLREQHVDFLMRLPAGRKLFKQMVRDHAREMENMSWAVRYDKRALFVRRLETSDLYGDTGFVYMVLDPQRKAKALHNLIDERYNKNPDEIDHEKETYEFIRAGLFMLISSKPIPPQDVLQAYYTRQTIEQIFRFAKSDLDLLPLRCHSEEAIRGYLFLQFLLLIVFIEMRKKLNGCYTVEQSLLITRPLKCKVFNNRLLVQDLTKDHKSIFELSSVLVPTYEPGI